MRFNIFNNFYGVPAKRNHERFPTDFMFQLTAAEVVANCDYLGRLKFARSLPYAFSEHDAIHAANVLASPQAVGVGVYMACAFVRLRELVATHAGLAKPRDELEHRME